MKISTFSTSSSILDVENDQKFFNIKQVYSGISATETQQSMLPHQKESFLNHCREFYREAIQTGQSERPNIAGNLAA